MTAYLIRRFLQMILVVFLSTMAIYILLNVAPGGPLSGLRVGNADRRAGVSDDDIRRLEAYLGIDKPLLLRYVCWLFGDDWLGADWMSLSWGGFRYGEREYRFWADPGIAQLNPGLDIYVMGPKEGSTIQATYVQQVRPSDTRPEGAISVRISEIRGADLIGGPMGTQVRYTIHTGEQTQFVIPDLQPRPQEGSWLDVRWLFNANRGLLGGWAGLHGENRGVLRLDWGTSWVLARGQPVTMLVESRLKSTLILMSLATVVSLLVAVPIGILSAVKQYSVLDYTVTTFSFFGSAMPVFWFALMMILLFSYKFNEWGLPFFPASGMYLDRAAPRGNILYGADPRSFADYAVHLIMPTIVLSLLYMAGWSRFTRSSMLEVLRQDYVRTARAKGLRERVVLGKHALRNALIPLITIVVFQLPGLFGGAIITETVFKYKGMGLLYYSALIGNDWPVAMILLLITAILVVVATLLGDVLYTVVDPRIRLG